MSSIRVKHIVHSYGEHTILEDFSMDIQDGEFINVIGGDGNGRTTVLKLISGPLIPDQGEIYVQDRAIHKVNQNKLRRNIGYVIQSIGLFPHVTIEENIGYVLSLARQESSLIRKRVKEMMDIMKLEKQLLNRYPDKLGGGQKQRIGTARALASHPEILLVGEPFGTVDEITRYSLQDGVPRICHELHITIFFIIYDIREALRLGARVMIMKDGNIEQFDIPGVVKKQPQTEFARQLLSYLNERTQVYGAVSSTLYMS